jgi:hypothetical protein
MGPRSRFLAIDREKNSETHISGHVRRVSAPRKFDAYRRASIDSIRFEIGQPARTGLENARNSNEATLRIDWR